MNPELNPESVPAPADLRLLPVVTKTEALSQLTVFQDFVKGYLVPGQDFGKIPGTDKDTLLNPGAQKLCEIYGFYPDYEITQRVEDWDKEPPLFDYEVKCTLKRRTDNVVFGVGLGSCNSYESKYRWRLAQRTCPECAQATLSAGKDEWGGGFYCNQKKGGCGKSWKDKETHNQSPTVLDITICQAIREQPLGRAPNDDIASQKNTILKMAKKRAFVDATISATRSANIFTQDVEDFVKTTESHPVQDEIESVDADVLLVDLATKDEVKELMKFANLSGLSNDEFEGLCLGFPGVTKESFFKTFTREMLAITKTRIMEHNAMTEWRDLVDDELNSKGAA